MDDARLRTLKTAARYLGATKANGSFEKLQALLEEALANLHAIAMPRHVLKQGAITQEHDKTLLFEGLPPIQSGDLCRLFQDCREGLALLATLGMEVDLQIRRLLVTNPAMAMAVSACGSAYVDEYIDRVLEEERSRLPKGYGLTPRFGPGYGDVPLSLQPSLLLFLGGQKLGVHLTQGFLMMPEKSVTALMGITPKETHTCENRCALCQKTDCAFRDTETELPATGGNAL